MDPETQLVELEFLSCEFESMDSFAQLYETMLKEAELSGDMRTAQAMREILLQQAQFLLNQWLKEKQKMGPAQLMQLTPGMLN